MINNKIMKISIITPSFNSAKTIEKTILSVLNQTYNNIEYIIIDGGSTDGTFDIIKKYQDRLAYWVSEPDKGISDAFNKGLAVASGDYINFQGADDYLLENNVVELMMKDVDAEKDMLVCGKIRRIDDSVDEGVVFETPGSFSGKQSLLFRMSLPHQALFTNKKFFAEYGVFAIDNRFCMDYELLLRAYNNFPKVIMKDVLVSAWRAGGVGKGKTIEIFREYFEIKNKNRVAPFFVLKLIYYWDVLKYFIKIIIK
jgi:glycosyltransferase involved in cell wall biosynthesis